MPQRSTPWRKAFSCCQRIVLVLSTEEDGDDLCEGRWAYGEQVELVTVGVPQPDPTDAPSSPAEVLESALVGQVELAAHHHRAIERALGQ